MFVSVFLTLRVSYEQERDQVKAWLAKVYAKGEQYWILESVTIFLFFRTFMSWRSYSIALYDLELTM